VDAVLGVFLVPRHPAEHAAQDRVEHENGNQPDEESRHHLKPSHPDTIAYPRAGSLSKSSQLRLPPVRTKMAVKRTLCSHTDGKVTRSVASNPLHRWKHTARTVFHRSLGGCYDPANQPGNGVALGRHEWPRNSIA